MKLEDVVKVLKNKSHPKAGPRKIIVNEKNYEELKKHLTEKELRFFLVDCTYKAAKIDYIIDMEHILANKPKEEK